MRVVKLGGRVQQAPEVVAALAAAWQAQPGAMCVVHGGGDSISALQRAFGTTPVFAGGRRVTTGQDLELVRMALSGAANKQLVAALCDAGVPAWGVSGEDGSLLEARELGGAHGYAGTPAQVRPGVLHLLLQAGYLPVISPMARNAAGKGALNVNGDDAAAAFAVALEADELLFVADVPGVRDESGEAIARLEAVRARELTASGAVNAGMAAKLEAAEMALAGGVQRVRVGAVAVLTDPAAGTLISNTPAEALV